MSSVFSRPRVGCAVLAAGAGARFDQSRSKLVSMVRGKLLLQWALDAACGSRAERCSAILGAHEDVVRAAVDFRRCATYRNGAWREGMSASIRLAVEAHEDDDALLFVLGDQPRVGRADLDALIARWCEAPSAIVMLRRGDVSGAPAIFGRSYFDRLRALEGDAGAKRLLRAGRPQLAYVEAADADAFADVDVIADLAAFSMPDVK